MHICKLSKLLAAISPCFLLFSCTKNRQTNVATTPSVVNYRAREIKSKHLSDVYSYRIVYNGNFQVDSIVKTGAGNLAPYSNVKTFSYDGYGCKIATTYSSPSIISDDIYLTYNSNGKISKAVTLSDTMIFSYDNQELTTYEYRLKGNPSLFRIYKWNDGNVDKILNKDSSILASNLFLDEKTTPPEFESEVDYFLRYGKSIFRTKNLPSQYIYANMNLFFYYNFDQYGRVAEMLKVSISPAWNPDTTIYSYSY